MRGCRSHQPPDPTCATCAGRYARRIARVILTTNPRQLHAVNFPTTVTPGEFHSWRVAARNLIDHRRRESRWWSCVQMQVWLGADGQLRGVVSLDAVTPDEFEEAFGRWEPSLRRIGPEEVADVVLEAARPDVIAHVDGGGYKRVRFTVKPKVRTSQARRVIRREYRAEIEPMPVIV
jgi:hypothetical protein